jgi:hypothetical protein
VVTIAVIAFLAGLLLAVRVMFFGVQRRIDEHRLAHRAWPLALSAFLMVAGAMLYARADRVTPGWTVAVVIAGVVAGAGAWWLVKRSAAVPSTDPEDDPRYRFQGHVARVIQMIGASPSVVAGRIAFEFDGRRHELQASWVPEGLIPPNSGQPGDEVVIERVEGEVAFVEPWTSVEKRL